MIDKPAAPLPRRYQPKADAQSSPKPGAKPKAGARRPSRVPFALLVCGLIVGGLCALLALNTASAANELSRHDLASKDDAVAIQVQQLRNEVAASAAPGALANAAAQLGMAPATDPAFLVVGANGRVKVMGSPGAVVYVPPPAPVAPATGPKPKPKPSSTSKPSKAKASPTAPKSSAKSSAKSTAKPSKSAAPSKAKATPTSTPTPITSLPGGPR